MVSDMTIPDRHDHELASNQRRIDAAQARHDELAPKLAEQHDETFDEALRLDDEWVIDELCGFDEGTHALWRAAYINGDHAEMGRIMTLVIDRAKAKSRQWFIERELR